MTLSISQPTVVFQTYGILVCSLETGKMKKTRTVIAVLAVAVVALSVSDVLAQGRGGRGGFGGPGGPGGFGGRGGGDPTLMLLQREEVREELDLFPDQEQALGKLREQAREEARGGGDIDFRSIRDASPEKRREIFEKLAKQRQEAEKKMRKQLEEVLLPEQLKRLDQIGLQVQGVRALQTDEVAAALEITDAQKEQFEKHREEMGEKMRAIMAAGDRENMREKMQELQTENEKQMLAVLTDDQKSEFEAMKGEPFELTERRGFGQRGRGGRGDRGRFGRGGDRDGDDGGGRRRGRGGRPEQDN